MLAILEPDEGCLHHESLVALSADDIYSLSMRVGDKARTREAARAYQLAHGGGPLSQALFDHVGSPECAEGRLHVTNQKALYFFLNLSNEINLFYWPMERSLKGF